MGLTGRRVGRGGVRRLLALCAAVSVLVATPGMFVAQAKDAGPGWREQLGALAEPAVNGSSVQRRVAAAAALVAAVADTALLVDDDSAYVDENRLVAAEGIAEVVGEDKKLAVSLQAVLNKGSADQDLTVPALNEVLAADVQTARLTLVDARAYAGEGGADQSRLAQASSALDQAVSQWRAGQPVAVLSHVEQSLRASYAVLDAHGVGTYDLQRDTDRDSLPDLLELRAGSSPRHADTDRDGLTDAFEVLRTVPAHVADQADTDADGRSDAAEDVDGDGLTALQEQERGTDPLTADLDGDGDGLNDDAERRVGLDPANPDTDGDGVGDADEVTTSTATSGPVTAVLTGTGDLAGTFRASRLDGGPADDAAPGRVGPAYDLGVSDRAKLLRAEVSLPFDAASVPTGEALRMFTYDPGLSAWVPVAGDQQVDRDAGTVTATLEHFSIYAIFSIPQWKETMTALGGSCRPGGGSGATVVADIAFVLDASGSMSWNDPNRLRQQASKNFVDALLPQDKGAVVSFASWASLLQGLTSDKGLLRAAIDRVGAGGGTNIGAGVQTGLDALAAETDPTVAKIMILLTDGVGSYSSSLTARAGAERVTIYTVGLGSDVDAGLLQSIAAGTGGTYYPVRTAEDLPEVFREIERDTGDDGRDTDEDGLSDCEEERGFTDLDTGTTFTSDPRVFDTDGDGLPDGAELTRRALTDLEQLLLGPLDSGDVLDGVIAIASDPRRVDSDGDDLDDFTEAELGSSARRADTDFDDLPDGAEEEQGSALTATDSDDDGYSDHYEATRIDDGFDPLSPTEVQSKWAYLRDFSVGATCGDLFGICQLDSVSWLAGSLVSGFAVYGDVRDAVSALFHRDLVGIGFAVGGAIPLIGDAVKSGEAVVKFIRRVGQNTLKGRAAIRFAMSLKLPSSVKAQIVEEAADGLDAVRRSGISNEAIERLAKRTDFRELEAAVRRAAGVDAGNGSFRSWRAAEDELRRRTGSQAREQRFLRDPANPTDATGSRRVDAWDPTTRTARECKSGYVIEARLTETLDQIGKDRALLDAGRVDEVEWHFFAGSTDTIGADPRVLDALDAAGIPYFFHLP